MATMNAFSGSAFEAISLSAAIENRPYVPSFLGSLNLFEPQPVRTRDIFVDRRAGTLTLIPTSQTGEPPVDLTRMSRDGVTLRTTRLAKGFKMYASEVQGIRAFGQESELEAAAVEFLNELGRVRDDLELTEENHRLGALQGKLLDADGTTVIYNYFTEMGEAEQSAIDFALATSTTDVAAKCKEVTRAMTRAAGGSFVPGTTVHGLAGDGFYDDLISHPNVKELYAATAQARELRRQQGEIFESFTYGGITFHNYRGTDDNSTVAVPTDEVKFFPIGARGVFAKAQAPHETFEFANTLGRPLYAERMYERESNIAQSKWVRGDVYAYPLYICQKPRVLRKGTA